MATDTPRTDAEFTDDYYISGYVPTEFAQQLERELAEATRDASNQREKQSECLRELAEKTRLLVEAQKDAERYRFIRKKAWFDWDAVVLPKDFAYSEHAENAGLPEMTDEAIDAALNKEQE